MEFSILYLQTLQTSMYNSSMYSTRRHGGGGYGESTRVTVLKDKMAMTNRMSSKVGSYSPPTLGSDTPATSAEGPHVIQPVCENTKIPEINGQIGQQDEYKIDCTDEKDVMVESQL